MFCSVMSGGVRGIESFPVSVETDISNGIPTFEMVGYVGNEVRKAYGQPECGMYQPFVSGCASRHRHRSSA